LKTRSQRLADLLTQLSQPNLPADFVWQSWRIQRIEGGQNNLLYHADGPGGDLAVKFTIRDRRDRAGREYVALRALRAAGLAIAPDPVLLDRTRYSQPVVVQSWLAGEVSGAPPATDDEWLALLGHYVAHHTITPSTCAVRLRRAVLNLRNAAEGRREIRRQLRAIPQPDQPAEARGLLRQLEGLAFPTWPAPPAALCRTDPNIRNFVRRGGGWASVDWENSGWGDPAFEIADTLSHPTFLDVPAARRDWAIATYCELRQDAGAETRIRTYYPLMLVWWVARLARLRRDLSHGQDQRLAAWPEGWLDEVQAKYARYLELATLALDSYGAISGYSPTACAL
jgi:aminoglycoside phosphotransferase (APT) family kinase protein